MSYKEHQGSTKEDYAQMEYGGNTSHMDDLSPTIADASSLKFNDI